MRTERPEPILPARDLAETRASYEKLGFVASFKGRGPYLVRIGHDLDADSAYGKVVWLVAVWHSVQLPKSQSF